MEEQILLFEQPVFTRASPIWCHVLIRNCTTISVITIGLLHIVTKYAGIATAFSEVLIVRADGE